MKPNASWAKKIKFLQISTIKKQIYYTSTEKPILPGKERIMPRKMLLFIFQNCKMQILWGLLKKYRVVKAMLPIQFSLPTTIRFPLFGSIQEVEKKIFILHRKLVSYGPMKIGSLAGQIVPCLVSQL